MPYKKIGVLCTTRGVEARHARRVSRDGEACGDATLEGCGVTERELRDKHAARLKGEQTPSRHLLLVDETNLRCLAAGIVTARVQMQAKEYVELLEADTLPKRAGRRRRA